MRIPPNSLPEELVAALDKGSVGGDWELRNRLKVYEGVRKIVGRDFQGAAKEFQDALATFTATELVSFEDYIFYTALCSMIAMDRKNLKTKVIHSPEVLSVIDEVPGLRDFMMGYYECDYKRFFKAFVLVIGEIYKNRYLKIHARFISRTMRLNAYRQFLASHSTVTLATMAAAFGVTPDFIDDEISQFIANGKIACKIDKVEGVIVSGMEDDKNAMYKKIIKHGDLLLNRIQKLSKVIDM